MTARDEGADSFPAEALVIIRDIHVHDNAPVIYLNISGTIPNAKMQILKPM